MYCINCPNVGTRVDFLQVIIAFLLQFCFASPMWELLFSTNTDNIPVSKKYQVHIIISPMLDLVRLVDSLVTF